MHGGKRSGAPLGNQNAVRSGDYTAARKARKFWIAYLLCWIGGDGRYLRDALQGRAELADKAAGKVRPVTRKV